MDFCENWGRGGGGYNRLYFKLDYGCLLPHPLQSTDFSAVQGYVGNVR